MDNFLMVPKALLSAKHFVSPATGEHIELTPTSKLYLCMLIDRNKFFKNKGHKHYDTHQYFADELGVSESGIRKIFDSFKKHDVIKASSTKHRCSGNKIVYDDVIMPVLVERNKTTKPAKPIIVKSVEHTQTNNHQPSWLADAPQFDDYYDSYSNTSAPAQKIVHKFDDEADQPF